MKEGYLQKKGQRLKGWKQRWFVCDGRTLSYYITSKDRRPNAIISLDGCTVQDGGMSETWQSPRIYLTDRATGVLYCLSSEDAPVVIDWLHVLRKAVAQLSTETHTTQTDKRIPLPVSCDEEAKSFSLRGDGGRSFVDRRHVSMTSSSSVIPSRPPAKRASINPITTQHPNPRFRKAIHTSVALENEIINSLELLEAFIANSAVESHGVCFFPLKASASNSNNSSGILKSLGRSKSGKLYGRVRFVLPVTTEVAAYFITDHNKRLEWDAQFPVAKHLATFDESTSLIHLSEGCRQIHCIRPDLVHQAALSIFMAVIAFLRSDSALASLLLAILVLIVSHLADFGALCYPRDALVLRHCRERSAMEQREGNYNHGTELYGESIVTIVEKSVTSELKPGCWNIVRANISLSGWQLEPVELGRTLCTFVTDIDAKGWLPSSAKEEFLQSCLDVAVLLQGYVSQVALCGRDGLLDDNESVIADDRKDHSDVECDISVDKVEETTSEMLDRITEFHPRTYLDSMEKLPTGVLKLIDKQVARKQSGVLKDVIKSAGAKILEGKSAVSLSLPVRIFEPRTNLERIIDLFLYAPTLLKRASEQADPLERFKYVIAFAVAGLHHGLGQLKPFNPILGETYQTTLNDGTEVACEHTSHHPPVSNFQLIGSNFTIDGHVLWAATFSMKSNALIQTTKGPIRITFEDGTIIHYTLPQVIGGGFLWGDRTVELAGVMIFEDPKNRWSCELKFNPDKKEGMGGIFSTSKTPADCVRGSIVNTESQVEICQITGSWLDELLFGGNVYWDLRHTECGWAVRPCADKLLPSDSRFREDLQYLAKNDLNEAQDWKVKLEVLQRVDRSLRTEGRRPTHWTLQADHAAH
uniref:Uncharacterized protein AlNc14C199G8634 n=1 Tax=Albugo laibachii Nc14 TaxID=890382 RepID=F0WQG3_9STRA|nr:conserved hypothetical protein [Albugo laibachii Nc14]|eukprot:CCA23572.1 conserved hypothetical protein [Albugo laibachii Nc14]